jgi:hypothetical protein
MKMKTKDFNLAALLVANNIKLVDYETDELGQMWFEFPDDALTRELEHSFNLATVMVNLHQFVSASKMLKTLIYQNRRNIYEHKFGKHDFNTAR